MERKGKLKRKDRVEGRKCRIEASVMGEAQKPGTESRVGGEESRHRVEERDRVGEVIEEQCRWNPRENRRENRRERIGVEKGNEE